MGALPVSVAIPLPFCLRLRDGEYQVCHRERVYLCHLRKVWSDFASGCNPDEQTESLQSELLFQAATGKITKAVNVEIDYDKKGFFRHTLFYTTIYLDESFGEETPSHVILAALPLINKLLAAYRYVTGEFQVTEIQWQDLCMVRDGKLMPFLVMDCPVQGRQRKRIMGWFAGDESPITTIKPNVSKQNHKAIERILLEKNPQVPLERDLLLNAKDYSRQGRYGLTVFELGTTLEIGVNNLLLSKGVNEKRLRYLHLKDKYDRILNKHVGVSLQETNASLYSIVLKIWNIRNNVAHKRVAVFTDEKGDVIEKIESKEQVEQLIRSTEQTLDYLDSLR